ncbi:MAG: CBS domain-containing protein [Theionarchaea archaeon]|nr:CBS domain-containing protein [Theionarchaea archaeon]
MDISVEDIMKSPPIHVDKDQRLSFAVDLFEKHSIARLPVLEEGQLVGMITQRDIMDKIGIFREDLKTSSFHISSCMSPDPIVLHPDDPLKKAITIFVREGFSGIPILDGELVGIVTKLDIIAVYDYSQSVKDIYTGKFLSISVDERVVHARQLLLENNERCLPVINTDLEGIITTADVVFELYKFRELIDKHQSTLVRNISVLEAMNQNPVTTHVSEELEQMKAVMIKENLSTLPVVDDENAVIGLISKDEMIDALRSR